MTPYEIGILLHYFCRAADPTEEQFSMRAPAWRPTIDSLVEAGLIEFNANAVWSSATYKLTAKGEFYVTEGICNVPLPVADWKIPERQP